MIYEFGHKAATGFIRNKFGTIQEVKKLAKEAGNLDVYTSIFGYENLSVEACPIYSGFYIDLDNENLELAYADLLELLLLFKNQSIKPADFTVCFSGNKGFHLYISPLVMGILPDIDLSQVYRKIAEELLTYLPNKSLDLKVYERRRLWRLVNSKHGSSGLYKIQIPYLVPSLKEILELAKTEQPIKKVDPELNIILEGWVRRARRELYEPKETKKSYQISYGEKNMNSNVEELLRGVGEGQRNQTCFYLACYLKSKGFSEAEILQHLLVFGSNCIPPMNQRDIETTFRSALKERLL